MGSDDDDAVVLRPDAYDVVHIVVASGSLRRAVCASWNQNITGNGLCWGTPLPCDHPTCLYCIYYEERDRRMHRAVRELSDLANAGVVMP